VPKGHPLFNPFVNFLVLRLSSAQGKMDWAEVTGASSWNKLYDRYYRKQVCV